MKKTWVIGLALFWNALPAASAAPGEWWEMTSKMEMPGMPFSMPATTTKICIAKGAVNDPNQSMQDKECEMTDIKTSGNKTTWKMRCVRDGEVMNGTGENTSTADSYHGTVHISGKSRRGKPMDMTSTYSGKRVGSACDSSAPPQMSSEAQKQLAPACETSGRSTDQLLGSADILLQDSACPGKSKVFCDAVRKDAGRDAKVYDALTMREQRIQPGQASVVKSCGLDMAATTKSICKTINENNIQTLIQYCPAEAQSVCKKLNENNFHSLSAHCPAEAKAQREVWRKQRIKECEGRSYTAQEDLSRCIGDSSDSHRGNVGNEDESTNKTSNKPSSGIFPSGTNNPADQVIDGAKKLKGLLGF